MTAYKPGAQYRVQIDTVMTAAQGGVLVDERGVCWSAPEFAAGGATVTEVAPPEPPVGSIWRVPDNTERYAELIENVGTDATFDTQTWLNHSGSAWLTWDEVRALPGGLIYTPGVEG